jgi:hypothetical protein
MQAACNIGLYLWEGQVRQFGPIKDVYDVYERDLHQMRTRKLEASYGLEADDTDAVEILRVEVVNEDEAVNQLMPSDRPAKIKIHYNAYRPLGKVHLSVFIFRSDGVMCCMMRTKLDGFEVAVERGQGVVEVQMTPLQLVGGSYYAEAWFLDESDSNAIISKANRSDWFTVKGKALSYNESSIFEPMTQWRHLRSDIMAESRGSGTPLARSLAYQTADSPLDTAG